MQHLRSIISSITWDRMKKLCALLRIKFFSQQDDTKNANPWWRRYDSMAAFLMQVSDFQDVALLSQKSKFTYQRFSIVWLPWVKCLLLLCKAKPAWIKRSIHYVTICSITIRGSYSKKFLPTSNVTLDTKEASFESDIASVSEELR